MITEPKSAGRVIALVVLAGFIVVPTILARTSPFNAKFFDGQAAPAVEVSEPATAVQGLVALVKRLPTKLHLTRQVGRRSTETTATTEPQAAAETATPAPAIAAASVKNETSAATTTAAGAGDQASAGASAAPGTAPDGADLASPATGGADDITVEEAAAVGGASFGFWKLAWVKAAPFLKSFIGRAWTWLIGIWQALNQVQNNPTGDASSRADATSQSTNPPELPATAAP